MLTTLDLTFGNWFCNQSCLVFSENMIRSAVLRPYSNATDQFPCCRKVVIFSLHCGLHNDTVVSVPIRKKTTNCHLLLREIWSGLSRDKYHLAANSIVSFQIVSNQKAPAPNAAPLNSTEVWCWSHGHRQKPSGGKATVSRSMFGNNFSWSAAILSREEVKHSARSSWTDIKKTDEG